MITLHHLENSRSQRILWLLEELELKYEIKIYKRDPLTMLAPPELLQIHPLGKSPVITDRDRTLAESGAIIEYLLDTYGDKGLRPADRTRYNYWLHYAEGSLMPPLLLRLVLSRFGKSPVPALIRPFGAMIASGFMKKFVGPQLKRHIQYIDSELQKSNYLTGDSFSAADIQMSYPLEAAKFRSKITPSIEKYLERILSRPAYARAVHRAGDIKF